MASSVAEAVVRKSVQVRSSVEHAFSVFVEQMETWWPATHHMAKEPFELIVVEPRLGGRWYERSATGVEGEWGKVLAWDPPHRVTLSWHVGPGHDQPDWVCNPDPAKASEVEIRFSDAGEGMTLIQLEHSRLDRHGEGWEALRALFDGPGAWQGILDRFAAKLDEQEGA